MTCLELSAERIKRFINQGCETGANRSSTNRPEEHEKRDWGKYWGTVRRALCPLPERSTAPQHPNGGLNAAQRKEGLGSNPRDFSVTPGSNPSVFLIRLTLSSWTDFSKSLSNKQHISTWRKTRAFYTVFRWAVLPRQPLPALSPD